MRKLLFFAACLLFISTTINAQNFLEKNCKHLLDNEQSTRVSVTGKMFEMISTVTKEMQDEDLKNARKIFSKIKSFELVAMEDYANSNQEISQLASKTKNYEPLVKIKDKADQVSLLIKEKNGVIYELVGFGSSENNFFAFSLEGEIKLDDIMPLTEKLEKESISPLSQFRGTKLSDINVYPNPNFKGNVINVELPDNLVGGKMKMFDATGKLIKEQTISQKNFEVDPMTSSNYVILEFNKDSVNVTKKVLIIE